METETNSIKQSAIKMAWHMRGGASYEDMLNMSTEERKAIANLREENFDTTKKSGLPFF